MAAPTRETFTLPALHAQRTRLCVREDAGTALLVAELARRERRPLCVLAPDSEQAMQLERELRFFLADALPVRHFPDWEILPWDSLSPQPDIVSERLATLAGLPADRRGVLVLPVRTALQRLPPPAFIDGRVFVLEKGARFDPVAERARLARAGYRHVDTVLAAGEYAIRGAVVDIFPMGERAPCRIELFDDEIESLHVFDPDTQRRGESLAALRVLPGREYPLDEAGIAGFRERWHRAFDVDVRRCPVYQDVSAGQAPAGVEFYLPLFFDELATIFDYVPEDAICVTLPGSDAAAQAAAAEVRHRHEERRHDVERPVLPAASLYLAPDALDAAMNRHARVLLLRDAAQPAPLDERAVPDIAFNARTHAPAARLLAWLDEAQPLRVLFTAESAGRREVFAELLRHAGIQATTLPSWAAFADGDARYAITEAPLAGALWLPARGMAIVPEQAASGSRPLADRRRPRVVDPELVIRNLTELHDGAPVVHLEHGIGRYRGLTHLTVDAQTLEFLVLEYQDAARLYVPVSSLHLVSRYSGADAEHAPLHRLGSDQWDKAKRRAAERVRDVAAELLDIYARRAARPGQPCRPPDADYTAFAEQFAFEETPDQAAAIDAVIADLVSERPMDRLVCGDVGFGKTEVAMRAAFVAVHSGRQVAVLVPTTLLAQQHYETFCDRFVDWPVRIEAVSRLRTDAEVAAARERIAAGGVDIVVGTQVLLARDWRFRDLGLVVIDEEHRFGVRDKDRLKALRAEVDVLALTATPIPRTLNMAMSGIRDMSVIATPPARRLAVKTFIREHDVNLVREAIERELARGGQVFYLYNEVRTIAAQAERLQALLPGARIAIAHGQMAKRDLDHVMADFQRRHANVLLCTTIVESGIDIPNANTIVIDRADKLGLAQLHQLRGRVGRSPRQAYAYLLTPHPKAMTAQARKRLEALEAAGELGVGFSLATHDLEIRGAGELLGDEQSGQMEGIGFSLYMDLLSRAVAALKAGREPDLLAPLDTGIDVNLHAAALIPDTWIPDVHTRLILYKRIASAADATALDDLRAELRDRFGELPVETLNLFRVTQIRLRAASLGITRIDVGGAGGFVDFAASTPVTPLSLLGLIRAQPGRLRLDAGGSRLRLLGEVADFAERAARIEATLAALAGSVTEAARGAIPALQAALPPAGAPAAATRAPSRQAAGSPAAPPGPGSRPGPAEHRNGRRR
jgi:transcription-repair coupling factor (superfamily II helicase)